MVSFGYTQNKKRDNFYNNVFVLDPRGPLSSSATNVNTSSRLSVKPHQDYLLSKTHSATNVFARPTSTTNRNSLNSMDSVQYGGSQISNDVSRYSFSAITNNRHPVDKFGAFDGSRYGIRRGSSVENVNSSTAELNSNGGLKKIKYESEVSTTILINCFSTTNQ